VLGLFLQLGEIACVGLATVFVPVGLDLFCGCGVLVLSLSLGFVGCKMLARFTGLRGEQGNIELAGWIAGDGERRCVDCRVAVM